MIETDSAGYTWRDKVLYSDYESFKTSFNLKFMWSHYNNHRRKEHPSVIGNKGSEIHNFSPSFANWFVNRLNYRDFLILPDTECRVVDHCLVSIPSIVSTVINCQVPAMGDFVILCSLNGFHYTSTIVPSPGKNSKQVCINACAAPGYNTFNLVKKSVYSWPDNVWGTSVCKAALIVSSFE